MKPHSPAETIKAALHESLATIGTFEQCALLNYPDYNNIGDHLIWLGEIFYLTDVMQTKIKYTAAGISDFCGETMERQIGDGPILLTGGGNIGDLWCDHQAFREEIIPRYLNRPIIIFPQSIYFANPDNLKRAAKIFNSHPNLILFTRDDYSYGIAAEHFYNCKVLKSPDMAFQMVGMSGLSSNFHRRKSILYHCRTDKELNKDVSPKLDGLPNLITEDWISNRWDKWKFYKLMFKAPKRLPWSIRTAIRLFRDPQRQNLSKPNEWLIWQIQQQFHPYVAKFDKHYDPMIHRASWSMMQSGIFQLNQHRLIITNRLHGHILCILLGIPHIFLGNSYYKNEAFYQAWTHQIPFCKFVKDPSQVELAAQELLRTFQAK
jgi:exopolysaccharide biosynthesis predicted pyruvyltransferase EpsI